jgi:hypothetical protein
MRRVYRDGTVLVKTDSGWQPEATVEPRSGWDCDCGRVFSSEFGLAQHRRMTHDEEE